MVRSGLSVNWIGDGSRTSSSADRDLVQVADEGPAHPDRGHRGHGLLPGRRRVLPARSGRHRPRTPEQIQPGPRNRSPSMIRPSGPRAAAPQSPPLRTCPMSMAHVSAGFMSTTRSRPASASIVLSSCRRAMLQYYLCARATRSPLGSSSAAVEAVASLRSSQQFRPTPVPPLLKGPPGGRTASEFMKFIHGLGWFMLTRDCGGVG